jgi:hypothetical protein
VRESKLRTTYSGETWVEAHTPSDYKDDGKNILLDANENAYGPGLALNEDGTLSNGTSNSTSTSSAAVHIDLLGLNRYPDPYVSTSFIHGAD